MFGKKNTKKITVLGSPYANKSITIGVPNTYKEKTIGSI